MRARFDRSIASLAVSATAALLAFTSPCTRADSLAVVPPAAPGPFAVGCSDLTQDFSRLAPGESPSDYWEGRPDGNRPRYVINLLADLDHAFFMSVAVPNDGTLYGSYAGAGIDVVTLVCYPTSADNPRPGYTLPNGVIIPHMQQQGASPLWPDMSQFPVLLFSHGLGGSPLSGDYMDAIKIFASHGYVVVTPFHADSRVADTNLDNLSSIG